MASNKKSVRHIMYGTIIILLVAFYLMRFVKFDNLVIPTKKLIERQNLKIKQLENELANKEKLIEKRKAKKEKLSIMTSRYWQATDKIPTNKIQQKIERLGKKNGVTLNKVGAPKIVDVSDNIRAIDITISSTTSIKNVSDFLQDLENERPLLTWHNCVIRPNRTKEPTAVNISGKVRAYIIEPAVENFINGGQAATVMGKFLIIINITLTIVAVYLTRNLLNPATLIEPEPASKLPVIMQSEDSNITNPELDDPIPKLSRQDTDILWEKNLFHPDRTFEENLLDNLDIKEPEQINEHFELMSIAQVSNKSCASIRVIKGAKNQRRQRNNRRPNRRRKNTRRGATAKDTNQKIYMLGESVGETGYKLTEIGIDYIIIKKGDQELTLRLDKSDESSEKRREVAKKNVDDKKKKEIAARNQVRTAEKKGQKQSKEEGDKDTAKKSIPPPPPPPPPPPAFNRGVQQPTVNQGNTNMSSDNQVEGSTGQKRRKSQYPRPTRR